MGSGDIEIAAMYWDCRLGFQKIINGAVASFFVLGGIYGGCLLLIKKPNQKTAVPFGPFLIIGGWIAYTLNYGFSKQKLIFVSSVLLSIFGVSFFS